MERTVRIPPTPAIEVFVPAAGKDPPAAGEVSPRMPDPASPSGALTSTRVLEQIKGSPMRSIELDARDLAASKVREFVHRCEPASVPIDGKSVESFARMLIHDELAEAAATGIEIDAGQAAANASRRAVAHAVGEWCMARFKAHAELGPLAENAPRLPLRATEHALAAIKKGATLSEASAQVSEFVEAELNALKSQADKICEAAILESGAWLRSVEVPQEVTQGAWERVRDAIVTKKIREAAAAEVCGTPASSQLVPLSVQVQHVLSSAREAAGQAASSYVGAISGLAPWMREAHYQADDIRHATSAFNREMARSVNVEEAEIGAKALGAAWAAWKEVEGEPEYRNNSVASERFDLALSEARHALRNLQEPSRAHQVLEETVTRIFDEILPPQDE